MIIRKIANNRFVRAVVEIAIKEVLKLLFDRNKR